VVVARAEISVSAGVDGDGKSPAVQPEVARGAQESGMRVLASALDDMEGKPLQAGKTINKIIIFIKRITL
jgi:hypothetical protein